MDWARSIGGKALVGLLTQAVNVVDGLGQLFTAALQALKVVPQSASDGLFYRVGFR
jgi:hypothetical protein